MDALVAARHASFWQQAIDNHGEAKAAAFYTHLGLNHLERKSFEYDGLTLSREPNEHEKVAVKGIANAQESAKESIGKILLSLREELVQDGLKGIKKLKPATFHGLTLQASPASRNDLRDRLIKVHRQGQLLVAQELNPGKSFEPLWGEASAIQSAGRIRAGTIFKEAIPVDEFDDLDMLTDLTDSRVANDVQARIIDATTRYSLLGLTGKGLLAAVESEMASGSVAYIDRAARGLANRVINLGRSDEMAARADDIERYEQSALLDQNVCDPCAADDGQSADNPDDLPGGPNPGCLGSDQCRCFVVAVAV